MREQTDIHWLLPIWVGSLGLLVWTLFGHLDTTTVALLAASAFACLIGAGIWIVCEKSKWGRMRKKRLKRLSRIPIDVLTASNKSVRLGTEPDLGESVFLPDRFRTRHVHIVGSTGSGKTESVILNFIKQDVARGLGTIILDAKGDNSFLDELSANVPTERLKVFDLGSEKSLPFNPLACGSALESAQRLFASMTWSEEYYKSKALSSLQRIFDTFYTLNKSNPTLRDVAEYLESPSKYATLVANQQFPKALAIEEFKELAGLRDQVRSLVTGHLVKLYPKMVPPLSRSLLLPSEMSSTSGSKALCRQSSSRSLAA